LIWIKDLRRIQSQLCGMVNHPLSPQVAPRKHLFDAFLRDFARTASADEVACSLGKLAQAMNVKQGSNAPLDPSCDALVYVGSGATKLIASASKGREQIVAFHFAGDLVSIPAGTWHSYRLCALVDTDVLAFPTDKFIETIGSEPVFLNALLQRTLSALHRCHDKTVVLGRKSAKERLASFLVGMADRIGSTKSGECQLDLPMSRRDISDSLGLTIETISRQFRDLRLAGLVETTGRSRVFLRDPSALAERAMHT